MTGIPSDNTTTATFEGAPQTGASISGEFETFFDTDWIQVSLVAGKTYSFYAHDIEPGQGYGYHIDASVGGTHDRIVSGLFYLRDIVDGGETEFPFQLMHVKPKAGLLLLFPPFWTHLHRGVSPVSAVKYNITNFVILRPQAPRAAAT